MKRVVLMSWIVTAWLVALVPSQAAADPMDAFRWLTDYAAAHQIRVDEQRPMIVFVTMDGCHFCDKMLQTTYADRTVASEITDRFVPTKIDVTRQLDLAQRFGVRIFPTTFVISADNRVMDRIEGYVSPADFRERLAAAQTGVAAR